MRKQTLLPTYRSLHYKRPFVIAAFWWAIHFLGIVSLLTGAVLYAIHPSRLASEVIIAAVAFCIVTWFIAFFKRRSATCPLCKGTPLLNTGALPHVRAKRVFPLNHGVTALATILLKQSFTCMYCGSLYDMLRESSQNRQPQEGAPGPPSDEEVRDSRRLAQDRAS